MDNLLIMIFSIAAAILLVLILSFVAAHKTVNKTPQICQPKKRVEGEVLFDDICEKYLKLTNLE